MSIVPDSLLKIDLSSYDPRKWKDCGHYWLYETNQGDTDWLLVRLGRPSGSNCGALIGHNNFDYSDNPDDTAKEIAGLKKKEIDEQQREAMDHGKRMESFGRDWYSNTRRVKVGEIGFVVPKWDLDIGVSIDGDVIGTDGIIEIKAPKNMYRLLETYMFYQKRGVANPNNFSHIPIAHYDQMHLGMAVLKKKWCDYIVYCTSENKVFTQRIPFNEKYWNEVMYPALKFAIQQKIKPLLRNVGIPLMPPQI